MLQLEVADSLELGSSTALPLGSWPRLAICFLSLSLLSNSLLLALPSLAATTGRAAAPFATSSPSALPATSILQVCPPLPFPSAVRDGAPPNPNKTIVFGSESSYNVLPANLDFVCKNYRVYMCTPVYYAGSAPTFDDDMAKQRGRYDRQPHRAGRCKFL